MDRKTFFRSSIGIAIAGILAKPIIESLETKKTDAEKMIDGAKAIDMDFKILFDKTIRVDEDGSAYINIRVE